MSEHVNRTPRPGQWEEAADHPELVPSQLGELCAAVLFLGLISLIADEPGDWLGLR